MGLENITARADQHDTQTEQAAQFEPVDEPEQKGADVVEVDPMEAAENRAEALLRVSEGLIKVIIDSRLFLDDDEIESGRKSLAPVIDKYNLAGEGSGRLPYQEEITAGFYLGGLFRRFKRAWAELVKSDKAKKAAQEAAENGNKREYPSTESPHAVPSQERVRQKPNPDKAGWDSEDWGTGAAVGHEQGSSGA